MQKIFSLVCLMLITSISLAETPRELKIDQYLASIAQDPVKRYAFFYAMPKGSDLHNHLSGATYAENLLLDARGDHLCLNPNTYTVVLNPTCLPMYQLDHMDVRSPLYYSIIDAWSMRDFKRGFESGHDHFFSSFGKFGLIAGLHTGNLLSEVLERAGEENESYLEFMVTLDNNASGILGSRLGWNDNWYQMRKALLHSGLPKIVEEMSASLKQYENQKDTQLSCHTPNAKPGCQVTVRYLYQVLREQAPQNVFAQLLAGFELANQNHKVVGINMVQAEDGPISMRDYHLQMMMVGFLHQLYPKVHISLHAGELVKGLVPDQGLAFHIREAVELAHAERIGHGVDIIHEKDYPALLNHMRKQNVMVEINLTSNQEILGVDGDASPLPIYLAQGVPVSLSTDDEGVERTNLSRQYEKAYLTYHFSYPQLKYFARSGIAHSFVSGPEKERLLKDLDARFAKFEKSWSGSLGMENDYWSSAIL